MKSLLIASAESPTESDPNLCVGRLALAHARMARAGGGRAAIVTPAGSQADAVDPGGVSFSIPARNRSCRVTSRILDDGVQTFSVRISGVFPRKSLYAPEDPRSPESGQIPFIEFSHAITEIARRLNPVPSELILYDWPTALGAALIRSERLPFRCIPVVVDPRFQGLVPGSTFGDLGLPQSFFRRESGEFFGSFSLLKCGLTHADRIVALSFRQARSLPFRGAGLEGLFARCPGGIGHLPASLSVRAALAEVEERGSARALKSDVFTVVNGLATPQRSREFFEIFELLKSMGFRIDYTCRTDHADRIDVERVRRLCPDAFLTDANSSAAGVIFLDEQSMNPVPALRSWINGAVVCAAAAPPLEDARAWLKSVGFDTSALLLYRTPGADAIYDILREARRMAPSILRPDLARLRAVVADDAAAIFNV